MKEILINTALGAAWLFLTILQVRAMGTWFANVGTGTSLLLWLVGQCIILSPVLMKIWRERHHGDMPASGSSSGA